MLFSCAAAVAALITSFAAEPHIEKVERFGDRQLLIHFNTEPNRAYVLQYTDSLSWGTNGVSTSTWSNLFSSPPAPFVNHFIVTDWRTNA